MALCWVNSIPIDAPAIDDPTLKIRITTTATRVLQRDFHFGRYSWLSLLHTPEEDRDPEVIILALPGC